MSQKNESELTGLLVLQWPLNADHITQTSATDLTEWLSSLISRVAEFEGSSERVSMDIDDEYNAFSVSTLYGFSATLGDPLPGAAECYLAATGMVELPNEVVSQALQGLSRDGYIVSGAAIGAAIGAAKGADEGSAVAETDVSSSWGPPISDAEAASLERKNLHLQVAQRREQLTTSYTRVEAADMLGVSPQTVSDMVAKHRLIGIKDGREWRFPAWQFTPDSAEPVLPELVRLVREFPGGVVSLSRWMNRPNGNFEGRTPQQEMLHDSDHVFAVINALTAA